MDNREDIMFSDLNIGTERPGVYNGLDFARLSQVGSGAPPNFVSSSGGTAPPLIVTAYSVSAGVVTFTFTAQGAFVPVPGTLYKIAKTGNTKLDGFTFAVLGSPPSTTTTISASAGVAVGSASGLTATSALANQITIKSINQDCQLPNNRPLRYAHH